MVKFKKGDTLIEVMFAVSVFAAIMVGGLALMNSGLAKTQGTLQLSMARNAIDSQAEALRYLNASYIANYPNVSSSASATQWSNIATRASYGRASNLQSCPANTSEFPDGAFVIDTQSITRQEGSRLRPASTYPRLVYSSGGVEVNDSNLIADKNRLNFRQAEGIWIEPVRGDGYYDFHIRACWNAPGSNAPTTLGTIVRLYAPN